MLPPALRMIVISCDQKFVLEIEKIFLGIVSEIGLFQEKLGLAVGSQDTYRKRKVGSA